MKSSLSAAIAVLLFAFITSPANAAIYTIISSSSENAFGFDFGPTSLTETSPGSSRSSLSGTIDATVALGGGSLVFGESGGNGTSNIIFDAGEASAYLPVAGGPLAPGNDEINADGSFDAAGNGDGQFTAGVTHASLTVSDLAFLSISDHVMTFEGTATTGGSNVGITTDLLGYTSVDSAAVGPTNAELRIVGNDVLNETFGTVGYSLVGDVETITIPYDFIVDGGPGNTLFYSGTVVAARTITAIPEPTSSLFLACVVIGGCVTGRRRR